MKKIYTAIVAVLVTLSVNAQIASSDYHEFTHDGSTYRIVKVKKNWNDAVTEAIVMGGYLAEPETAEENEAIHNAIVTNVASDYASDSDNKNFALVYIGIKFATMEEEVMGDIYEIQGYFLDGNNDNNGTQVAFEGMSGYAGSEVVYHNWASLGTDDGNGGLILTGVEPDQHDITNPVGAIVHSDNDKYAYDGSWVDCDGSQELYFVVEIEGTPTAINENDLLENTRIYPNPSNGTLNLQLADELVNGTVTIFNLAGQKVFEKNSINSKEQITCDVAKGIYVLTIQHGEDKISKKITFK